MKSFQYLLFAITSNITSVKPLQTFYRPQTKRPSLLQRQVGLSHDLPPPEYDASKRHIQIATACAEEITPSRNSLTKLEASWTKHCMIAYIAHMCVALPLTLLPTFVKSKLHVVTKAESENEALRVGQACARTLLALIPFMNLKVTPYVSEHPVPTIWVSNHVSMLDTFVFLAADEKLRGKNRRPLKTIYVSGLCRLMTFHCFHVIIAKPYMFYLYLSGKASTQILSARSSFQWQASSPLIWKRMEMAIPTNTIPSHSNKC